MSMTSDYTPLEKYLRSLPVTEEEVTLTFERKPTEEELRAASLQFVRKVTGFNKPSKANEAVFDLAVEETARGTLLRTESRAPAEEFPSFARPFLGDELVIARPGGRKQTVVIRGVIDTHIAKADARELYEDRTPPPTPGPAAAGRGATTRTGSRSPTGNQIPSSTKRGTRRTVTSPSSKRTPLAA
mgnify:CR=1 FL=1